MMHSVQNFSHHCDQIQHQNPLTFQGPCLNDQHLPNAMHDQCYLMHVDDNFSQQSTPINCILTKISINENNITWKEVSPDLLRAMQEMTPASERLTFVIIRAWLPDSLTRILWVASSDTWRPLINQCTSGYGRPVTRQSKRVILPSEASRSAQTRTKFGARVLPSAESTTLTLSTWDDLTADALQHTTNMPTN